MNFKLTVSLTILLMLALIIYIVSRNHAAMAPENVTGVSALFSPKPSEVTSISFSRYKQERLKFVKEGTQWKLTAPTKADADNNQVSAIAGTLQNLTFVQKFSPEETGTKSPTYTGTGDPTYTISFSDADNHQYSLAIGKRNSQGGVFVTTGADKTIYVLDNDPSTQLDKNANSFRNLQIVELSSPAISSLVLKSRDTTWTLTKSSDKWLVTQPVQARASSSAVEQILNELQNIRAINFSTLSRKSAGLEPPDVTTLTITSADSKMPPAATPPATASAPAPATKTTVLQLGYATELSVDKKDSPVFAGVVGSDSVFVLSGTTAKAIMKELREVRDPAVSPLAVTTATDINVTAADGKSVLAASQKDGTWNLTAPMQLKADPLAVSDFLNAVHGLMAIKFVDGAGDLKAMGLDPAQKKIELTLPGQAQHEVILLGTPMEDPEKGKTTPAMRQGESSVFVLPSSDIEKLSPDTLKLRDKELAKLDAMHVRSIVISGDQATTGVAHATTTAPSTAPATASAGTPGITLEREGTHWNATKEGTSHLADDSQITSLLAQFTPLTATRYVDQTSPTGTPDVTVTLSVFEPNVAPPATVPATSPATAPSATTSAPASVPDLKDLLPSTMGPESGKMVTHTLRLYKVSGPASAPATAPATQPSATWKAVWDGQSPAWAFEPSSVLVDAVTKSTYATSAPPATAPATQAATKP